MEYYRVVGFRSPSLVPRLFVVVVVVRVRAFVCVCFFFFNAMPLRPRYINIPPLFLKTRECMNRLSFIKKISLPNEHAHREKTTSSQQYGVDIAGVVVNKVDPDEYERTRKYLAMAIDRHWRGEGGGTGTGPPPPARARDRTGSAVPWIALPRRR